MKVKILVLAIAILGATSLTSQAKDVIAADQSNLTQLCMSALTGNRAAMHNSIKASGYSRTFIAQNLQCNGMSLQAFVQQHGDNADAMLRMFDRKGYRTSITDLAKNSLKVE